MLKPDEFSLGAPVVPKGRGKAVNLLSAGDEPEDPQPTDLNGHVVPAIVPFIAADAKGDLITAKGGETMPRGVYDRTKAKKRTAGDAAAAPPTDKPVRKPRKAAAKKRARAANAVPATQRRAQDAGERFAVWSDGSVEIDAPGCKGHLSAESVATLYAYVTKLRGDA
jgi:hypothetical protein